MKKIILLLTVLCFTTFTAKADSENCPTSVSYDSTTKRFNFYYAGGIPKDGNGDALYDRIQIENSVGQGSQWYSRGGVKIKIISKSSNNIITNNASDSLDGTSEMYTNGKHKDKITYWNGSIDLRHDYSSSDKRFINHCYYNDPLPVKLISFKYVFPNFTWVTASEVNNAYFILQSSRDTRNWGDLDTIPSKAIGGTSNYNITYYSKQPPTANYYRLIQVDFDGTFEYSNTIYIKDEVKHFQIISDVVMSSSPMVIIDVTGGVLFDGTGRYYLKEGMYFIHSGDSWYKVLVK